MTILLSRKKLREFIEILRNETCLWLLSSKYYLNREMRNQAYQRLLSVMQAQYAHATVNDVKRKIQSLKRTLSREMKKISEAKKHCPPDQMYKPKLWYYDSITFLADSRTGRHADTSDDEADGEIILHDDSVQNKSGTDQETSTLSPSGNDRKLEDFKPSLPEMMYSCFKNADSLIQDEYDSFGQIVCQKLRKLSFIDKEKALIAEHLINQILYKAEVGNLTSKCKLIDDQKLLQNNIQFHGHFQHSGIMGYAQPPNTSYISQFNQ